MDFNDPFYRNGDNLKDPMWPCHLKGSKIPQISQNKISKRNFVDKSPSKKTTPTKHVEANKKSTQTDVLKHLKLKIYRNLKVVNRNKRSIMQVSE